MAREGDSEGEGGGEGVDETIATPLQAGNLRKLRQEYARAAKNKVASSAYVEIKSSDSESEDDESDSEVSFIEFESMEEPTFVEDLGPQLAAVAGGRNTKQLEEKCVCDECGFPPSKPARSHSNQEYATAVQSKVASSAYVDIESSDSESENDESDSEDSFSEFSSMVEPTFVEDLGPQLAAVAGGRNTKQLEEKCGCDECGFPPSKPARSHSNQKAFGCPDSGCGCAYKRKDHLNLPVKKRRGLVFFCPLPGCDERFIVRANLRRHLKKAHERKQVQSHLKKRKREKVQSHLCSWPDCGKIFRYRSLLRIHDKNVHEELECAEHYCIYPGCGDKFSSEEALVTHSETCHPYLLCDVCRETFPRISFLRHLRTHAKKVPLAVVCPHDDSGNTDTRIDFQDEDHLSLSKPRGGSKPVEIEKIKTYLNAILGR